MNNILLFALLSAFRVAFVGDPQVDNPTELAYARQSVYSELRQRTDLDLVVVLGDLVNENPSMVEPSEASLDSLGCPWIRVNGNHDGDELLSPRRLDKGNVHFLFLNNVRRTRKGYEGALTTSDKAWLDSTIRSIPVRDRVVLCAHIPFSQCRDRDSIHNILSLHRNVLAFAAHTHSVDRHILDRGIQEIVAGASCGSWWRGVKGSDGVPYALMNCGAPRGYYIADFKTWGSSKNWYSLDYKVIHSDLRASVHLRDGRVVVNVFGGSREGRVFVLAGGRKVEIPHSYEIAPEVQDIISCNSSRSREYRKAHKDEFIPARRLDSPHIWAAEAPWNIPENVPQCVTILYEDSSMRFKQRNTPLW